MKMYVRKHSHSVDMYLVITVFVRSLTLSACMFCFTGVWLHLFSVCSAVLENGGSEDLTGSTDRIQVHETELLITRARVEDSGKYVCNATNNKGVAVATGHLKVYSKSSQSNLNTLKKYFNSIKFVQPIRVYCRSLCVFNSCKKGIGVTKQSVAASTQYIYHFFLILSINSVNYSNFSKDQHHGATSGCLCH